VGYCEEGKDVEHWPISLIMVITIRACIGPRREREAGTKKKESGVLVRLPGPKGEGTKWKEIHCGRLYLDFESHSRPEVG
jgi:hypothetical protein